MPHLIATVINFSTNEARFLGHCLKEAKRFSSQVIVTVCDHFFNGAPENRALLHAIYAAHPDVEFVEFPFDFLNHYGASHWHNLGRLMGFAHVRPEIETLLFLDVDEIVQSETFLAWLAAFPYSDYEALRLACYWYFREPIYRATRWEDTPLLVKRSALHYDLIMHPSERAGSFASIQGKTARKVLSLDQFPMIHHYSWVRTKEQMLRKVESWGHRDECDWSSLVQSEFASSFSGRDFVHGYSFEEVPSQLQESHYSLSMDESHAHVRKLTLRDRNKIELSIKFAL